MLNFDFLERDLGIVSPPHYMYNFLRNMFLVLEVIQKVCSLETSNFWTPFRFVRLCSFYMYSPPLNLRSI